MFERFTERARQVVVLAGDESRRLGHPYIGTEHLLLGLQREAEGIAARVLAALGVVEEDVRAEVVRSFGQGDELATGQIPFTPGAKKVLELSLREAFSLGHDFIGTEHILLGLAREQDGVAARILRDHDADAETVRTAVISALSAPPGSIAEAVVPPHLEGVDLTSPPLAPEVIAELERLATAKQAALDRQSFEEAARLRDSEHRLFHAAARLVRAWRRHTGEPT